jgi:hypothetical protein
MTFNFGEMPRWISCSMGWSILVFTSSKVINCIMLWEQNIFLVGTRYYIEGTRYIFLIHGLNQPPYFSEAFVIFLYTLKLFFLLSHIFYIDYSGRLRPCDKKNWFSQYNILFPQLNCSHNLLFFPHHVLSCYLNILFSSHHILSCYLNILFSSQNILFCYLNILFCYLNILFCSHHILSCYLNILFCSHHVLSCYLNI